MQHRMLLLCFQFSTLVIISELLQTIDVGVVTLIEGGQSELRNRLKVDDFEVEAWC